MAGGRWESDNVSQAWVTWLDSKTSAILFHFGRNFERKKENIIIKISKQEKDYLIANGIGYGENGIKSSSSHHKSWYVTESKRCMYLLREYRNKTITASVK